MASDSRRLIQRATMPDGDRGHRHQCRRNVPVRKMEPRRDLDLTGGLPQSSDSGKVGQLVQRGDLLGVRQVEPVPVLDQREFVRFRVLAVRSTAQICGKSALVRPPPPLTTDDLVVLVDASDDDWWELTPGEDRFS